MKTSCFFILITIALSIQAQRNNYADVLNICNKITDTSMVETSFFSDLGAWHAYALPKEKEDYGSFIGPLLMDMEGKWLGNNFTQLHLMENDKEIDLSSGTVKLHYYPGLLQQEYEVNGLKISLNLIFISNRNASIETKITNLSGDSRKIDLKWTGKSLLKGVKLSTTDNQLFVRFPGNDHLLLINYEAAKNLSITTGADNYTARLEEFVLGSNESAEFVQTQCFYLNNTETASSFSSYSFSEKLTKNEQRWNTYIKNFWEKANMLQRDIALQRLAVKCIVTLTTNWRSAGKDILHDGVFPSASYQGFYAVWSWDSWKQAVALSYFNPLLARNNVLCMFDYQDKWGMIADCIFTEKKENNWRDTKPPLASWAVWKIYVQTRDVSFVVQLYPKLVQYHEWWYKNRDNNKNGLCEYGSTDGSRIAAAWESGMDNAVRFDSAVMLKNNDNAWSLSQESVDLNVYLYAEKLYLSEMAKLLGKIKESEQWLAEAENLKDLIEKNFYSKKKGFYFDKKLGGKNLISAEGPEGWIALWAGISSEKQAKKIASIMLNEKKFNTKVPLPTLVIDHPSFDPMKGYWRGPVWLDQFYFGIAGLKKYGYYKEADSLTNKLYSNAEGLITNEPIRENYHPISGEGLNALNFSWSAAHILMILKNE